MPLDMPVVASFSGGRSSAVMLDFMINEGGNDLDRPDVVIFTNTGMETQATIDFIHLVKEHILEPAGVPLVLLEFTTGADGKRTYREVSLDDLDMTGAVFFDFVKDSKGIPNRLNRSCTSVLKIETSARYIADTYDCDFYYWRAIGFRADESRRAANVLKRCPPRRAPKRMGDSFTFFPLIGYGVDRAGVYRRIKSWGKWAQIAYSEKHLSNCQGCFFSGLADALRLCRTNPTLAKRWHEMEAWVSDYRQSKGNKRDGSAAAEQAYLAAFNSAIPDDEKAKWTFHKGLSWDSIIKIANGENITLNYADIAQCQGQCDSGHCYTD